MTHRDAENLINKYHIEIHKDFFTLSASEVRQVLEAADEWKYRKPKNANGSKGRYFFALLQRALLRGWTPDELRAYAFDINEQTEVEA